MYVPSDAAATGDCREEDAATFDMKWKSFVLTWSFAKVNFTFLIMEVTSKETFK
jgi:hypothetical protein